jgi:3-methyladenine DNA glycosylase AlkC
MDDFDQLFNTLETAHKDKDKYIRKLQEVLDDLLKRYAKQETIIKNKNKYINQLERKVIQLAENPRISQLEQRVSMLEQSLL